MSSGSSASPPKDDFDRHVEQIAKLAGIDANGEFTSAVQEIATEYEIGRRNEIRRPSEGRQTFETIRDSLKNAQKGLTRLSEPLTLAIWDAYSASKLSIDEFKADLESLARLSRIVDWAYRRMPTGIGAPSKIERDALFVSLARLYEKYTGEPYAFHDKRRGGRGSGLVMELARLIDPSLTEKDLKNGCLAAEALVNFLRSGRTISE